MWVGGSIPPIGSKIFMGDTGSLMAGIVLSILAIKFIEMNRVLPRDAFNKIKSVPVMTLGILVIPLFDTLRVFILRALNGKSPFKSDSNHLHHLLLDLGFSHIKATSILIGFNIFAIALVFSLKTKMKSEATLALLLAICFLCSFYLARLKFRRANLKVGDTVSLKPEEKVHSDDLWQ